MKKKSGKFWKLFFLFFFILLFVVGFFSEEAVAILNNATFICLSCIGIG